MPHERGCLPVPPSEFFCSALADPKGCFCRSPASHSLLANELPIQLIDIPALEPRAAPASRGSGPALVCARWCATLQFNLKAASVQPPLHPEISEKSQKDAQRVS